LNCDEHAHRLPEDATSSGKPRDKDNARQRIIVPVVAAADEILLAGGSAPLPAGVTAHKLRHTFASLLIAKSGHRSPTNCGRRDVCRRGLCAQCALAVARHNFSAVRARRVALDATKIPDHCRTTVE